MLQFQVNTTSSVRAREVQWILTNCIVTGTGLTAGLEATAQIRCRRGHARMDGNGFPLWLRSGLKLKTRTSVDSLLSKIGLGFIKVFLIVYSSSRLTS